MTKNTAYTFFYTTLFVFGMILVNYTIPTKPWPGYNRPVMKMYYE